MEAGLESKLALRNLQVLSEGRSHTLFFRDRFIALVERTESGFGSIGSTGVLTEGGLSYLVWREGRALLVSKGSESEADAGLLEALRRFSDDLKAALA